MADEDFTQYVDHDDGGEGTPDYEYEARMSGWKPEDEWDGKEGTWRSAKEFVERGREINPILRENNRKLMAEIEKRDRKLAEMDGSIKQMNEMYKKLSEAAYSKAINDVKQQMRLAQREGEYELAEELEDRMESLKAEAKEIVAQAPQKSQEIPTNQAEIERMFNDWKGRNPWYGDDQVVTTFADGVAARLAQSRPDLIGRPAFLDEVEKQTRAALPDKFRNTRRTNGSPVSGSSNTRSSESVSSGSYSWSDLNGEEQRAASNLIGEGKVFKDRKAYLKAYEEAYGAKH